MTFHVPEQHRLHGGAFGSDFTYGNNGAFRLPPKIGSREMAIIASDGLGWEHVSVHCFQGKREFTPTWEEMAHVKRVFWDDDDVVVQFHPASSEYVNNHPHTLHLWRPTNAALPTPPSELVGLKDKTQAEVQAMPIDEQYRIAEERLSRL